MSKYLDHSEHIASYLDGNMNPDQMLEFEKQLHTDPVLRSEFELQQEIIHTLKDFRKTQLKTRLDQVPVSAGPGGLMGIKAAAAIVFSGIIGLSTYLYFTAPLDEQPLTEVKNSVEQPVPKENIIPEMEVATKTEDASSVELLKADEVDAVAESLNDVEVVTEEVTEQPFEEKPTTEADAAIDAEVDTEKSSPVINSPNLVDLNFEETNVDESIEVPNASLAQEGLSSDNVVVETAKKDGDLFHYQYYSGKLYLYGDFRDNPYEILELNSANGKRLFIYYNSAYYRIVDNQQEITPLEKLTDKDIIKKLEIIQANK